MKILKILLIVFIALGIGAMGIQTTHATAVYHCWQHAEDGFVLGTGCPKPGYKGDYPDNYYWWLKCVDKGGDGTIPDAYYYKFAKAMVNAGFAKWLPSPWGHSDDGWAIEFTNKSSQSLNKKGYWEVYIETNWLIHDYRIRMFFNTDKSLWKNPF